MERVGKKSEIRRRTLAVSLLSVIIAWMFQFTCLAAENVSGEGEEDTKIEVLAATVIEDFVLTSEVSPYTMLGDCIIGVRGASDGMHIDISTGAVGTASVLGVKDVKIMKKVWYGWKTVAVSSGGESYNRSMMGISILYENAVKDTKYRITCIHYGNVDEYFEGENDTGEFLYTY